MGVCINPFERISGSGGIVPLIDNTIKNIYTEEIRLRVRMLTQTVMIFILARYPQLRILFISFLLKFFKFEL